MTDNFVSGYTSFHPLTPEVKSITSGFSFTKIFDFSWRKGKKSTTSQDLPEEPENENYDPSNEQNKQRNQSEQGKDGEKSTEISESSVSISGTTSQLVPQNLGQSKSENSSPNVPRKEKGRYRNVKTILRRLSAIAVDKKWHQTSGDFKHDFKQYWMPDEHCKECYECGGKFSTFRRRHHCRVCGQIFCSRCCSQEVPGRTMGFNGNIRVCNYCYKIVKAYVEDDIDKSLEALKEDMRICCDDLNASEPFGVGAVNSLTSSRSSITSFHLRDDPGIVSVGSSNSLPGIIEREMRSPTPRNPFDAFGVTPKEANDIKQDFLRDLWRQVTDARSKLELQSHRFRLKTYSNCFVGHELVDWLLTYGKAANRAQGVAIGQDLLDLGWIESVPATEEDIFRDEYMLYQPGKLAVPEMESQLSTPRDLEESSPCEDEGHESSVSLADDDDETLPIWFRQISSETVDTVSDPPLRNTRHLTYQTFDRETENPEGLSMVGTPSLARRFSSSRHLDLDQATFENGESKERVVARELSLQMKLDYFQDDSEKQVRKEIYDQTNKLSLITHVPPPPLDTYVCVEGHPFVAKKKVPKVASATHFVDDILRGIEFPKPRSLHQIEPRDPMIDDNGEGLARERLSFAAQHHLQALLKQLVEQDGLTQEWKDVIMPTVLRISEQVVPDVRRDDDMDIRQYVWFKAVPVGDKPECQVISGVVFTKHVVHKKMTCNFTQPRILMLSCAIEYQRVENKLTSIDPVVLQEYEFLKNFIARVVTLKPNIVLVEKTVARVAQDMLLKAGITLVHNIKSNVMENISRCTGADVLQSMEQVSRPRLGSCQQFRLHKYILPDGRAKTLMFFEGCAPDLGCSLVLQGADRATLAKVKAIMKYLIYVAYHLKLENKFLMDEFALPPTKDHFVPCSNVKNEKNRRAVFKIAEEDDASEEVDLDETLKKEDSQVHDAEMLDKYSKEKHDDILEESKKFSEVISKVILSSSPFCVYPLPYLLTKDGQTCSCRRFIPGQLYESRFLSGQAVDNKPGQDAISITESSQKKELNPNLIINEPHPFTRPDVVPRPQDGVTKCLLADFRARGGLVDLKMYRDFEELHKERRKEVNIKKKDRNERMNKGLLKIEVDVKVREKKDDNDVGTSEDRDKKMDCFDPYNHQRIAVLFSSYSSESHNAPKPCISPWAVFMEFYGRNDITLGGFLERYCFRPSYICYSHNCDVPMVNHVRYFAHGNGSLYIHMRNLESPIPGYDRTILTWSWCKQCKQVTPVVPLSFESWSLSFAKYLELRFYGGQYKRRASAEPCGHSLHQDHYQYFSFANMVASFKRVTESRFTADRRMTQSNRYRPIELYEVIIPSAEVVIGKERDPTEWFDDVEEFCCRAENVLMQISERINDLKTVDPGLNIIREQKAKEFQSEFQAEKYHFSDFMQCLRMKVDSLLSSQRAEAVESHSLVSSSSEFYDVTDNLKLKPSEVSALMTGIGNMLVNLKTKLCEIVLSWNLRLQEFHQQEKKREKSARPSSSPKSDYIPANIPSEMGEYYPAASADQLEDSHASEKENLKYTYIHSPKAASSTDQEPISEVLLTNGTILRQTYLGTHPPREYIASEIDNETLIKYGEEVDKQDGQQSELNDSSDKQMMNNDDDVFNKEIDEAGQEAENEVETNHNGKPLKIDLEDAHKVYMNDNCMNSGKEEGDERRKKVGSPYMVIQSPVTDDVEASGEKGDVFDGSGSNTEATTSRKSSAALAPKSGMLTRTGSVQVERGSLTDIEGEVQKASVYLRMESHESEYSHNSNQEHWMVDSRGRSGTVINTEEQGDLPKYLAQKLMHLGQSEDSLSHHSSMFVEDGSEVDPSDLISLQDVLDFSDEDRSYMSEADDNEVPNSDIGLGESAVDYEMINELSDDDLIEPVSFTKKLKSLGKEVDESSEYNSCESSPTMLRKKLDNYYTPRETKEDDTKGEETNVYGTKESDTMASKVTGNALIASKLDVNRPDSLTALGHTRIRRDRKGLLKRRYPPLGIQEDDPDFNIESDVKLLPALEPGKHGKDSDLADVENEALGPKVVGETVDVGKQRKQLFENGNEGLRDEKTSVKPRDILKSRGNEIEEVGNSDNARIGESEHRKEIVAKTTKDDIIVIPKRTSFSEGRGLGHRRLQSAPVKLTPQRLSLEKGAVHEESGIPGSPFELLRHTPHQDHSYMRTRSYSQGQTFDFHSSQDELTKIAEKICQVDRKDLEMDDPEEIQYDESLEETLGIPDGSSKTGSEKKSKDSSEVFDLDFDNEKKQEKVKNTSKGTSDADADDSEKESVSSASATLRNRGHMRQKSLQYKAFGLAESRDDLEFTKSSTLEASQNLAGQKRGAEKMKKIISHLLPGSNFQPVPQPFPPYEHYLLPAGDSVSIVINEKEPSSIIAYALSSVGYYNQLSTLWKALSGPAAEEENTAQRKSPSATLKKETDSPEINTNGVVLRQQKTQISTSKRPRSWAGVSSKNPLLEYEISFQENTLGKGIEPGPSTDTQVLEKPLPLRTRMSFTDQSLLRSVTSYDTSSNDMLDSPNTADFDDTKTDSIDGILDDKDDLDSVIDDNKTNHTEEKTGKKKDENKPQIDFNIKLQFQDNSAKFYCNVYYAEQFRLLRELIFPEGEERYIQSLSRCVFWKATGGKSGSSFSKSLDDRFVMKQMSRPEVQSFLDFAPHYFQYMDKALKEQRPTTLAKILGVYRIGFKNSQTNTTMRQDVLVMENLFFNRKVNKIFDLKGSVRSRYVHTSGKEDVLMDENLLEMICETPLFIRPHSKAVLSKAIHNDSEFLSSHSVMDYSLLVGIDEVKFELVVGIIDYIRTYTWDKKLENYVKSTGILGGQGKMPTVVSPAVYRTRFTEAMHRYFLMVPDKWTGFGADLT